MMADTDEKINECIEKSLNHLSAIGRPVDLKYEQSQRISIQHLLLGKDVIAILPTGVGKCTIFTVYAFTKVSWELFCWPWQKNTKQLLNWVSIKNGNRNDRIWNGNDRNRKWPSNFPHKIGKNWNLFGKLGINFRFRSFPFRIRSFWFPFFTETLLNWRLFCYIANPLKALLKTRVLIRFLKQTH